MEDKILKSDKKEGRVFTTEHGVEVKEHGKLDVQTLAKKLLELQY